jgi:ribosomal protein S18 acetylase RimI-like enzyme
VKTQIIAMEKHHLSDVIKVQKATFTEDLCEALDVFQNRIERFGQYYKVAIIDDSVVGYMICFPWTLGDTPINNEKFPENIPQPNCFYIHDITLLPQARGTGLAKAMIEESYKMARELGFSQVELVSVSQSGNYWDKVGFEAYADITEKKRASILKVYGEGARLMIKEI